MTAEPLVSRSFSLSDQIGFARISADWNPMHLDQAFARRTQVGAPVVHGVHHLAWATDAVLNHLPLKIANIHARFLQPLYLDEFASVCVRRQRGPQIEFEIIAANIVVAHVRLSSERRPIVANSMPSAVPAATPKAAPADLALEQLAGQTGAVVLPESDILSQFPALTEAIGLAGVRALLAASQIVGMACPGLHSLFAGLDINFDPSVVRSGDQEVALAYIVRKVDTRFRSLQIDISGDGVTGRLDAFSRPAPPSQPNIAEISPRVPRKPFRRATIAGDRWLPRSWRGHGEDHRRRRRASRHHLQGKRV